MCASSGSSHFFGKRRQVQNFRQPWSPIFSPWAAMDSGMIDRLSSGCSRREAELFSDQCHTHENEKGACTGREIESAVNAVVVIDQSEQVGPQGLANSHDHPVDR